MASATFEPQPLSAPLNDNAIAALRDLVDEKSRQTKLHGYLKAAVQQITEVTGALNDAGYERKARYDREQARRGADDPGDDAADRAHEEFLGKVDTLTKKMDTSIRAIIDDQTWLEDLPSGIRQAANRAESSTQTQRSRLDQSPTPIQSPRQREREGDDNGGGSEFVDDTMTTEQKHRPSPVLDPADTPHILLAAALTRQSRAWSSKTLTEKYAAHNDYKGFYRVLYDAKHPGESAPPMPDERLWFAVEEGRELISTQRHRQQRSGSGGDSDASDDEGSEVEIEIASEKVRLQCPITLLPYVDPVTSVKCNHSYEKTAILSMLQSSETFAPFSSEQLMELSQLDRRERPRRERELRLPRVKCPECNVPLTEADLQPNPALKRRVQRILARASKGKRNEPTTSDIEGDDGTDNDHGNVDVDDGEGEEVSDDEDDVDDNVVPGTQRRLASRIPQTQLSTPDTESRSARSRRRPD